MLKNRSLYLIIYILFFSKSFSQDLSLKIDGQNSFETNIIDSLTYANSHKSFLSVKSEVDSLQKRLSKIGYLENSFSEITKLNDSTFNTKFQLKKKFNNIIIYYDSKKVSKEVLKPISNNITDSFFELFFSEIEYALNFINSEIAKEGLPFTKLKLDAIKVFNNSLKAKLVLKSNSKKRTIDKIVVIGYEKFPKSYLKHFLRIKKRTVLDIESIRKKTQTINNLSFANQIKDPEVLFTSDSTALYLYIKKQKSNNFDGFLGFGTNETTNKIEFDGYLNLKLTNNLNFGETFSLLYKSDENEQRTFNINISIPYIFNSPVGTDLDLNIFKKDSTYIIAKQSANLFYQISPKQKIYAGISSIQSSNLLNENSFDQINDYSSFFYNAKYNYIDRNQYSFLFPIDFNLNFEVGFGSRKMPSQTEKQYHFNINTFKIFNLNLRNSIYLKLIASSLISDNYLENELLFFGGINSIRGFEENSIFASLHSTLVTEYRYQFSNSLYLHSILDVAYFENQISNIKEKLFGFGFGFGLLTKSGILKFNYANGKNEKQKFKLSNSKIHLSLTTIF